MSVLLDNVSVDTDGPPIKGDGAAKTLHVWATSFGGGNVEIQGSPNNGTTWDALTIGGNPAQYNANTIQKVDKIGQGQSIRAILQGSTGASGVNAMLFQ